MTKRVMIDIETLGTQPGCPILEIGIVSNFLEEHYEIILPYDRQLCARVELETLAWWVRHPAALDAVVARQTCPSHTLINAAALVVAALDKADEVWANSPSFDCLILRDFCASHYPSAKLWHHTVERDFRTVRALYPGVDYMPSAFAYGALADAIAQAAHLEKLNLWRA